MQDRAYIGPLRPVSRHGSHFPPKPDHKHLPQPHKDSLCWMCGTGFTPKAVCGEERAGDVMTSSALEGKRLLRKTFLHRFSCALLHRGQHVRVGVERDGDGSVPQHLRDDLGAQDTGTWRSTCPSKPTAATAVSIAHNPICYLHNRRNHNTSHTTPRRSRSPGRKIRRHDRR
jgi:hypothetical protein